MNLPDAHLAIVEPEKIVDYLLNPAHPDNGGKAAFFLALGFSLEDWQTLAAGLSQHGRDRYCHKEYGVAARPEVYSRLQNRNTSRRTLRVRTVWIIGAGLTVPRLVTA